MDADTQEGTVQPRSDGSSLIAIANVNNVERATNASLDFHAHRLTNSLLLCFDVYPQSEGNGKNPMSVSLNVADDLDFRVRRNTAKSWSPNSSLDQESMVAWSRWKLSSLTRTIFRFSLLMSSLLNKGPSKVLWTGQKARYG